MSISNSRRAMLALVTAAALGLATPAFGQSPGAKPQNSR